MTSHLEIGAWYKEKWRPNTYAIWKVVDYVDTGIRIRHRDGSFGLIDKFDYEANKNAMVRITSLERRLYECPETW